MTDTFDNSKNYPLSGGLTTTEIQIISNGLNGAFLDDISDYIQNIPKEKIDWSDLEIRAFFDIMNAYHFYDSMLLDIWVFDTVRHPSNVERAEKVRLMINAIEELIRQKLSFNQEGAQQITQAVSGKVHQLVPMIDQIDSHNKNRNSLHDMEALHAEMERTIGLLYSNNPPPAIPDSRKTVLQQSMDILGYGKKQE